MITTNDLLEVSLPDDDAFLKIKETLTRIGIGSKHEKKLYQSCHILHKQGRYFITHFKEMFLLDGKASTLSEDDLARRNRIAQLLQEWGLLTIEDTEKVPKEVQAPFIKIIPFKEKSDWELISKYTIGVRKH